MKENEAATKTFPSQKMHKGRLTFFSLLLTFRSPGTCIIIPQTQAPLFATIFEKIRCKYPAPLLQGTDPCEASDAAISGRSAQSRPRLWTLAAWCLAVFTTKKIRLPEENH